MSLKPPKKSDLGKAWMQARQERTVKISPEYHLIVTEGTETEPRYFEAIQRAINEQYRGRIQLDISGEGTNTVFLFDRAKYLAECSLNTYRHIWVVYDTDDFPKDRINEVVELCTMNSTEETEYHALWSNQCIELWYLLHFSYMHSDLLRTEYGPKLTECLESIGAGEYKKNRPDMYETLRPHLETAIVLAKRLDQDNANLLPAQAAPGTKVYELLEKLKPYL